MPTYEDHGAAAPSRLEIEHGHEHAPGWMMLVIKAAWAAAAFAPLMVALVLWLRG
jgi:hypothetical protein